MLSKKFFLRGNEDFYISPPALINNNTMRDKDSDNIYQVYAESNANLHCENPLAAIPAALAAGSRLIGPALRAGGRLIKGPGKSVYRGARKMGVPKGAAKKLARYGPGGAAASQLGGGDNEAKAINDPNFQSYDPETGRLKSQHQGKAHAGAHLKQDKPDPVPQPSPATQQTAKPVKMMGVELDMDTLQKLYAQIGKAIGAGRGIETDKPSDDEAQANPDTHDAVDSQVHGDVIAGRGQQRGVGADGWKGGAGFKSGVW